MDKKIFKNKRPFLIIFVLGLLLYSWTAFFDYSFLDDNALILENLPLINDISNIGKIFTEDAFFSSSNFYYRPILNISFMLDSFVSGEMPWFYHISNFLLHIFATCLLFILLIRLKSSKEVSLALSLFFLSHPALIQAVAWIPGRNDSLLTIFILSSFIFFINFIESLKLRDFIFFTTSFLLALFTKEAAIVFPLILWFYYSFINEKKLAFNEKLLTIFSVFACSFLWLLFRGLAMMGTSLDLMVLLISILQNSPAVIIGLGKLLLPFNLSIISIFKDSTIIYGILSVIILGIILVRKIVDKKYFTLGIIWFLIFFVPSLINPVPDTYYYFFEHRLYLPFIGLLIIFSQINFSSLRFKNKYSYIFVILILILFSLLTWRRLPDYRDKISFWSAAVNKSENAPLARRNLGVMYYLDGRYDEALIQYKKSLELNPKEIMVHNNMGVIYMDRGNLKEAEQEFRLELNNNPGYQKSIDNLNHLKFIENQLR